MSITELESRLEKIYADIELHKKGLENLEKSKSLVKGQLNAIRDPVSRLPLEIATEIFLRCLPAHPEPAADEVPMILLRVCNAWTTIALSVPSLWTTIHLNFPCSEHLCQIVEKWIQRTKTLPLSISLSGPPEEGVADTILLHSKQLKRLEICVIPDPDPDASFDNSYHQFLADLKPRPLPSLQVFRLDDAWQEAFEWDAIHRFLSFAPNLTHCIIENILMSEYMNPVDQLVLSSMRRLIFSDSSSLPEMYGSWRTSDELLKFVTAPQLEVLTLPMYDITSEMLLSFLQRSSPQLRELALQFDYGINDDILNPDSTHLAHLPECLLLIPTLARLEMWIRDNSVLENLATALNSFDTLPNLRDLVLRWILTPPSESMWDTLLSILYTRRGSQLRTVRIDFKSGTPLSIPSTFGSAVRELSKDDMEVSTGWFEY
ncbi:hypothetical protein FB45DRAFT_357819 [Roridomyces roridus]|uniref:F-box domain-containing protein n=1 Tax=Roridomyces roridus TaxID=1738132 RepID=A0AAD7C7X1_9AGAR|nr:hypothetical protein FB45DRAFT_357819 [Roridomyces roridus]